VLAVKKVVSKVALTVVKMAAKMVVMRADVKAVQLVSQ